MIRLIARLFFASIALVASTSFAQTAPASGASAELSASTPVEDFFRRPRFDRLRMSPDGKLIAAIVPIKEHRNIALIDLDKRAVVALTGLDQYDVFTYNWIGDRLLHVTAGDLDEAGRLENVNQDVLIDTNGRVVRDLRMVSRSRPTTTSIIAVLDRAGDDLIVTNNERNAVGLDAYRLNVRTGEKSLLTVRSPGDVVRFIADNAGNVRVAFSRPRGGQRIVVSYRRSNDDAWTTLRDERFDRLSLEPIAFDLDDKLLYVLTKNGANGNRNDIRLFDPETGTIGERIFESKELDAGGVVFDRVARKVVGVTDETETFVRWVDPTMQALQDSIDRAMPGSQNRITWGRHDNQRMIVASESETRAPVFYLFDRKTARLEELVSVFPWLADKELYPRRFVRYPARDGLSIPGYLTLPRTPAGVKPPLIVNIHGGPYVAAQQFGFDADAQFFASRGYAVFEPHFRGTLGYGQDFYEAGLRQWGLAMQDDVTDAVKWLVDAGRVDPSRVCLFGGSYGGYAVLWGLEKEPRMFRCGVAIVAVSDLEMMFDVSWSDVMRFERGGDSTAMLTSWIGDPDRDREKMRAVSPVGHADRIQAPLLLAYGGLDQRVPLIHGTRMRSALDKYGKRYEWVVYDDEGHGFRRSENRFDFYRRVDAFLAKNLAPPPAQ